MANWTNPQLTSLYTDVLTELKNRDLDVAFQFSPAYSTATNITAGTIRWNPTAGYWEIYSGAAWGALQSLYNINVDKLDGQDGSYYLAWANLTGVPTTFTPSAHTHDDRYFTETESDARFGNKLVVSGNNIKLQTFGNVDLATITAPYATSAGNAATVGGFSVGQNLLTASSPTFADLNLTGVLSVQGSTVTIGNSGDLNVGLDIWDNTGAVYRTLRWGGTEWQVEDATSTMRNIFHEGHFPDWAEVAGKPATFAPSAHGHLFTNTYKNQLYSLTNTAMTSYTGAIGELVHNSTSMRLHIHNGIGVGGFPLALMTDIPAAPDLSPYARKDTAQTFVGTQTMPTVRLTTTTALSLASTAHAFQIGLSSTTNLGMDPSSINARNNGAASALSINTLGGNVTLGDNTASVLSLNGTLNASSLIRATQAEAEAGTSTTKLMSPDRVKQAIDKLGTAAVTQIFTSSDTWVKPTGLSPSAIVRVEMWSGGGGGGRNTSSSDSGGGGGGGGGYAVVHFLAADLPATVVVTVGAGGAGATSVVGGNGGASSFGTSLTVFGGGGGSSNVGGTGGGLNTSPGGFVVSGGPAEKGSTGNIGTLGNVIFHTAYAGGGGGSAGNGGNLRDFCESAMGGSGGAGGASASGTTAQPGGVRGGGGGGGRSTVGAAGGRGEVRVTLIK